MLSLSQNLTLKNLQEFVGIHFSVQDNKARCLLPGCCFFYTQTAGRRVHSKPLYHHLEKQHAEEYRGFFKSTGNSTDKKRVREVVASLCSSTDSDSPAKRRTEEVIEYKMSKERMQDLLVEAVAVDGLPLSVFEKSGILKLLSPIADKVGVSLSQQAVRALILEAVKGRMHELQGEFRKRLVCVKLDLCASQGRHFLGVNVQAVVNGKLKRVTAALKEVSQTTTEAEITSKLLACLDGLGIDENQIYSLTFDNGTSVSDEENHNEHTAEHVAAGTTPGIQNEPVQDTADDHLGEDSAATPSPLYAAVEGVELAGGCVAAVGCAMHTLQLCVLDVLQADAAIQGLLRRVRAIVSKLHTEDVHLTLKPDSKTLPKLDCPTRWGSTYNMLESMIDNKSFLNRVVWTGESLLLSDNEWEKITEMTEALRPLHEAMSALRMKNITAGEFLAEWLKCRLQLVVSGSDTSTLFLQALKQWESSLLTRPDFVSAAYLDKRYNVLLTEEQEEIARIHLLNLWEKVSTIKADAASSAAAWDEEMGSEDIIECLLSVHDVHSTACAAKDWSKVAESLRVFISTSRINKTEDIFQWWDSQPESALKWLAEVALALPVTQASVGQTVAWVHYMLMDLRGLDDDVLEALVLLQCNA